VAIVNSQFQPKDRVTNTSGKAGGGGIGSKVGMVAGGVIGGLAAGAGTGGVATAQGAMVGAGAGAALGGAVGNMVSPERAATTAIDRRAQAAPQMLQSEQTQQLKSSLLALKQQPPDVQAQYQEPLSQAYLKSLMADNPKTGMA
jgi:hypothetical protein